ncbi:hypothetical protein [Variovorax paradoxus]|uniref:hypothetical protein n=1 Tax=Variovorax paradoxus TaxID=34073 RepID=UPI001933AEBD|nr:hypothetical protein INQ48_13695 [Variovorax paradoxus]
MIEKPFYAPVATPYRGYTITAVAPDVNGEPAVSTCSIRRPDDTICAVAVVGPFPSREAAHAAMLEAAKLKIDEELAG